MGMLIEGAWSDQDRTIKDGAYVRQNSVYAEPLNETAVRDIAKMPGRFHLIASLSCPWSHRTILVRALKDLRRTVPLHIAGGPRSEGYRVGGLDQLWTVPGDGRGFMHLHQLYSLADPGYTGRVTVPVLWDSQERRIVSNESVHILRALDRVAPENNEPFWTLRPPDLAKAIDDLASRLQTGLSNAVYRAGQAQRQNVYDAAVEDVFSTLEGLEDRLAKTRYLHGNTLTETDLRLWPTLVRFDSVYHGHFKCARRRLTDYPNLWGYTRDVLAWKGVAQTFDEVAIRAAYYGEDRDLNPFGIVATAPALDWTAPHTRERLGPAMITLSGGGQIEVDPKSLPSATATA